MSKEPDTVAARLGLTLANLYNAKRRALARLVRQSLHGYR